MLFTLYNQSEAGSVVFTDYVIWSGRFKWLILNVANTTKLFLCKLL